MKKILTLIAISGISVAAFAQGTVNWSTPGANLIAQTNAGVFSGFVSSVGSPTGANVSTATPGGGTSLYYFALLTSTGLSVAPTALSAFNGGSLSTAWLSTGLLQTNGAGANGRISPVGGAVTAALAANTTAGVSQNYIMVGWSANLGTDWATVLNHLNNWATFQSSIVGNGFFGVGGSVGTQSLSTASPGTVVIGINAGQINNTTAGSGFAGPMQLNLLGVTPTPEPGTMALAALGGASLLLFRRRK